MQRWQTRAYVFHYLYVQPAWRTAEPIVTATVDASCRLALGAARLVATGVPAAVESLSSFWTAEPSVETQKIDVQLEDPAERAEQEVGDENLRSEPKERPDAQESSLAKEEKK